MSKTLLRPLFFALLLFVGLDPFNRSPVFLATPGDHASAAQGATTRVEVTFDGLMVFQKVGDSYEVGVLGKEAAPEHEFKILLGNTPVNIPVGMAPWSLHVETSAEVPKSPNNIYPRKVKEGACNRLQDTIDGSLNFEQAFDFCWIMDMENEFNAGQTLALEPNRLRPIISLKHGELYTKFKYDEMQRVDPKGDPLSDFGFIGETIALRVDLLAGESLVLRGPQREIVFSLPQGNVREAGLYNAPVRQYLHAMTGDHKPSHFMHYYSVFSNEADSSVDIKPSPRGRRPVNRWLPPTNEKSRFLSDCFGLKRRRPVNRRFPLAERSRSLADCVKSMTVDDYACGAVLLGKRTTSLTKADVKPRP